MDSDEQFSDTKKEQEDEESVQTEEQSDFLKIQSLIQRTKIQIEQLNTKD